MSLINISNLTFAYDGSYEDVFSNVSFQIDTNWKLGFCGRNGRGKTTFLKLLMGQFEFGGTISASVDFEYFPYSIEDKSQTTLDTLARLAPEAPEWQLKKEMLKLGLDEDALFRPFETLSNGEQTKALLAGLFSRSNAFLLIDEPTNHLDMNARETVARYLNGKNGFILVSHDRAFLDMCVDHILSINRANIEVQSGNFTAWYRNKQMRDEHELAENERLSKDVKRLASAAREKAAWSDRAEASKIGTHQADRGYVGHKAAKMMKRAKTIERRHQNAAVQKAQLLKNIETTEPLKLHPLLYHSPRLLSLEQVSVSYGDTAVFRNLSFSLEQGERLAISGGNGTGKSSILKLISGESIPYTGRIFTGSNLKISYVPQDASFLAGSPGRYAEEQSIDETLFKAILRKLDLSRTQFDKDMREYSAGQKKKVMIARSLCQQAHVYIWDEPLNYIDLLSRMQIEELILSHRPTLVFVEHDRAFCANTATRTIVLNGG